MTSRVCYPASSDTLLLRVGSTPWTGLWTGSPEYPVPWEHSGAHVVLSVQVASPERFGGLLV